MAGYKRPGVEISQVMNSVTPTMASPDLEACIMGTPYYYHDIFSDSSVVSGLYTGDSFTTDLSEISEYSDTDGVEALAICDFYCVSGINIQKTKHLEYGKDFSVSNGVMTISGGLFPTDPPNIDALKDLPASSSYSQYEIKVGFVSKKHDVYNFQRIENMNDIEYFYSAPVTWNPLAYGAYLSMANAGRTINVMAVSGTNNLAYTEAMTDHLSLKEVYAIAPMSNKVDILDFKTHADTMSEPEFKKERTVFVNKEINWCGYAENWKKLTASQRLEIATNIQNANGSIRDRRVISVHPDMGYMLETRPIQTIKQSWIAKSFSNFVDKDFIAMGYFAKLPSDLMIGGVRYRAGTDITDSIWSLLMESTAYDTTGITVLVPVPGFYYCAQLVGQSIGKPANAPLTNVPGSGFYGVIGSQDIFSEENLDTMGAGGTWIMTQDFFGGPVYSRHQLTTDFTSVTAREYSITQTIDLVAKYVRESCRPFIGRYNITPRFLGRLGAMLKMIAEELTINKGIVKSLTFSSPTQDTAAPDTILVSCNAEVFYPGNYINVTIYF